MLLMNLSNHFVFLILFLASFLAIAQNNQIKVYTEQLSPYLMQDKSGKLSGLSIDVLNALTKLTGDTASINVMPWARAYQSVISTQDSIILTIARTPERETKFLWVGRIVENQSFFWGNKEHFKQKKLTFEELKNYDIVVSRDSNGHNFLKENNFPSIFTVVYEEQVIKMVYGKRIDLLMSSAPTLMSLTQKLSVDFDSFVPVHKTADRSIKLSIAFNLSSDPSLVSKYQEAFQKLEASGKLAELREKWSIPSQL